MFRACMRIFLISFYCIPVAMQDLAQLIELDSVGFDLFELAPQSEYELYMKRFGKSNTTQVCAMIACSVNFPLHILNNRTECKYSVAQ